MKFPFTLILLVLIIFAATRLDAQISPKDGSLQELPQLIDFENFNGVNLADIYPGWQEGQGYQQPQYAGGDGSVPIRYMIAKPQL